MNQLLPVPVPLYPRASGEKRLLNFVIDSMVCFAATLALEYGFHLIANNFSSIRFASVLQTWSPLFLLSISMAYYFLMEFLTNRTLGKILTNTLVQTISGRKPSLGQIAGRTITRFFPFEIFTFLGPSGEGLHDSLSGTRVVDTSKPPVFFKKNNPTEQYFKPSEGKPIPITKN